MNATTPPPWWKAALTCRCPRCGEGRLFSGVLKVRERCDVCGLDLSAHDSGDGPASLVIFVLGAVVVGLAFWVEFRFSPPLWVHAVLWLPLILLTTLVPLRAIKGVLIALQYHHKAAEGRLQRRDEL